MKLYQWNERYRSLLQPDARPKKVIDAETVLIEVRDLSFAYEGRPALFEKLNFQLEKSQVLVIKGESGAGKSTLLSLILGLNSPVRGEVKINHLSSNDFSFDLHKILAYVGPEPYLIQGTVRENLLYGLPAGRQDIGDEVLWQALMLVELKELIFGLRLKLDEPINDIPQLSYGQRQRLAFARAVVRKPSVLVLDEATANLDHFTEKRMIANLRELFQSCTCIIVTHKNTFDEIATQNVLLGR
jgi:ABC-type multidrug transport system fused ATPase/permease subunit